MNKYREIMDRIAVTPEMKNRVLSNISTADIPSNKVLRFRKYQKYLPAAACFLCLLLGAAMLPKLTHPTPSPSPELAATGIAEVENIEELSRSTGFPVEDITSLPFEVTEKTYLTYWGEMAEIIYSGDTQTLCFRKSMGQEDNSGDYNSYALETEISSGDITVKLKGNDGKYNLAVWTDGTCSYSISVSSGVEKEVLENIIKEIH